MNNAVVVGGSGVIGTATRKLFGITDQYSRNTKTLTLEELGKKKYVFICVPTPATSKGHDISIIRDYIAAIRLYGDPLIIVRSTTTPGQLEQLSEEFQTDKILHFPEFLTMDTWEEDALKPDIVVIGGKNAKYMNRLHMLITMNIQHAANAWIHTDLTTSELIKCSINNLYALKVIFANEMYDFAQKIGADWETVKDAMYARKWIGANHLDVFYKGKRGVRGPCLPKELEAMANTTKSKLLQTALQINERIVND